MYPDDGRGADGTIFFENDNEMEIVRSTNDARPRAGTACVQPAATGHRAGRRAAGRGGRGSRPRAHTREETKEETSHHPPPHAESRGPAARRLARQRPHRPLH